MTKIVTVGFCVRGSRGQTDEKGRLSKQFTESAPRRINGNLASRETDRRAASEG